MVSHSVIDIRDEDCICVNFTLVHMLYTSIFTHLMSLMLGDEECTSVGFIQSTYSVYSEFYTMSLTLGDEDYIYWLYSSTFP